MEQIRSVKQKEEEKLKENFMNFYQEDDCDLVEKKSEESIMNINLNLGDCDDLR